MRGNIPSKKKPAFPVTPALLAYLKKYSRATELPLRYEDLLRHEISVPLLNERGQDTLWETVQYPPSEQHELFRSLTYIYSLIKAGGDLDILNHLTVARIDYCTFGNTNPFRVRIINRLNDNYDHFYVKRTDASRVYGLELEELLSPNTVTFLLHGETLVEEHIVGIPGDDFMRQYLEGPAFNHIRLAKEFVKFNERCFVRLLGDMRSYNFVVAVTPDIEGSQFRLRAIDFDQQSYEGRKNFYLPQYFRENNPIIFLGIRHMEAETVKQYQLEERSLIAARARVEWGRLSELLTLMRTDKLSDEDKVANLRAELAAHHENDVFLECRTMGEIIDANIRLLMMREFRQSIVGT
ncbi:MAG TPA: hypothetical protein VN914_15155 [Polyangia bacterium]|nr:hypothetical protein [Polyangia bacterium]